MRKFVNNRKGFTLIELMMVIAVIGILAVVLIPKMAGIKDTAKESGSEANVRMVVAYANEIINQYTVDEVDDFEAKLVERLEKNDGRIQNPFSNLTAIEEVPATIDAPPAVIYSETDDNDPNPVSKWSDNQKIRKGAVGFAAYEDNGELKCQVFYYDASGEIAKESMEVIQ